VRAVSLGVAAIGGRMNPVGGRKSAVSVSLGVGLPFRPIETRGPVIAVGGRPLAIGLGLVAVSCHLIAVACRLIAVGSGVVSLGGPLLRLSVRLTAIGGRVIAIGSGELAIDAGLVSAEGPLVCIRLGPIAIGGPAIAAGGPAIAGGGYVIAVGRGLARFRLRARLVTTGAGALSRSGCSTSVLPRRARFPGRGFSNRVTTAGVRCLGCDEATGVRGEALLAT